MTSRTASGQFSPGHLALFNALYIFGLTMPNFAGRFAILVVMAALVTYVVLFTTTGNPRHDYVLYPAIFGHAVSAADYMVLTDTHSELRRDGQTCSIADASFSERLAWALKLFLSPRGVGWNFEPKTLPPRPKTSRSRFVRTQLAWLAFRWIVYDVFTTWNRNYPPYDVNNLDSLMLRCINIITLAIPAIAYSQIIYDLVSIVSVAICMSDPEEWPPLYGDWLEAYTVRRLWSRTWHQLFRRMVASHGRFMAFRVFRVQKGTVVSGLIQIFTAFIISGIIHQLSDYLLLGSVTTGGSFVFFLLQPIAIACEGSVIYLIRKMNIRLPLLMVKLIGYAWVLSWFAFCVPIMQIPVVSGGVLGPGPDLGVVERIWEWISYNSTVVL